MGLGAQGCGCGEQTGGIFGGNWIWLLALLFFCCGGRESLAGIFDKEFFGEDCTWLWILLAFWCCCKGRRRFC